MVYLRYIYHITKIWLKILANFNIKSWITFNIHFFIGLMLGIICPILAWIVFLFKNLNEDRLFKRGVFFGILIGIFFYIILFYLHIIKFNNEFIIL